MWGSASVIIVLFELDDDDDDDTGAVSPRRTCRKTRNDRCFCCASYETVADRLRPRLRPRDRDEKMR